MNKRKIGLSGPVDGFEYRRNGGMAIAAEREQRGEAGLNYIMPLSKNGCRTILPSSGGQTPL
jgi:hypothetical protein